MGSQNPASIQKVLFCTGKVYFDLIKERRDRGLDDKIAIHTLEQICPFPFDIMKQVSEQYCNAKLCWVQVNTRIWVLGLMSSPGLRQLLVDITDYCNTLEEKQHHLQLQETKQHTRRS